MSLFVLLLSFSFAHQQHQQIGYAEILQFALWENTLLGFLRQQQIGFAHSVQSIGFKIQLDKIFAFQTAIVLSQNMRPGEPQYQVTVFAPI